jgi:hypothetical protein
VSRAAVIGFGAISPLGRGSDAFDVTADAPLVAIEHDASLARAGFSRPLVARVADDALASAYGKMPKHHVRARAHEQALAAMGAPPRAVRPRSSSRPS